VPPGSPHVGAPERYRRGAEGPRSGGDQHYLAPQDPLLLAPDENRSVGSHARLSADELDPVPIEVLPHRIDRDPDDLVGASSDAVEGDLRRKFKPDPVDLAASEPG